MMTRPQAWEHAPQGAWKVRAEACLNRPGFLTSNGPLRLPPAALHLSDALQRWCAAAGGSGGGTELVPPLSDPNSDRMNRSLLIVDDDSAICSALRRGLASEDLRVEVAESAERALSLLAGVRPDVILSDVRMPGMSGLELLNLVRERARDVDVILMTAHDDLPLVARAMRDGATDFLVKPIHLHQLRSLLARVFEDREARSGAGDTATAVPPARGLVGRDPRVVEIFKVVGQVAGTRSNVVIRGESGTGKELIARAIHDSSPYSDQPFVAVNCTALPSALLESELFGHVKGSFTGALSDRRGRFAQAGRGTIFLDEIGDTSLDFQAKLLRVLQEREFYPVGGDRPEQTHARVIAATHRDLEARVRDGSFRQDLYYRLRVVEIRVPPLRERMADVPQLAEHFVAKAAAGDRPPLISREAMDLLVAHDWPGNVRELENTLARAVVLATGDVLRPEHLALDAGEETSSAPGASHTRLISLDEAESEHIVRILTATRGQKARAARILGVSRPRLDRLLRKYGIERPVGLGDRSTAGADGGDEDPDTATSEDPSANDIDGDSDNTTGSLPENS
jgi:DNA-binding NtrC family response regulator